MHPLVQAAVAWCAIGGAVALAFLLFGLERARPEARESLAFRPLIVPGLVLLWPLVIWRWAVPAGDAPPNGLRRLHAQRAVGRVLAVLLPLVVLAGLVLRPVPSSVPPVLIEAPR
jgi:hypothetical protein